MLLLLSRFSCAWLLATPWTAAYQAPLSMGFSRQEYWSGVPLPSPMPCPYWHKYSFVCLVTQSHPTLSDPMDCGLPPSPVHGIFQARVLEWVAISFSRGSFQYRDRTWVSRIVGRRFTVWATGEVTVTLRHSSYKEVRDLILSFNFSVFKIISWVSRKE